jgi:hypothetical protein
MNAFNWQRLWDMYQRTYFATIVMFVAALALVIYAFRAHRQQPLTRIIGVYAASSALQVFCNGLVYLYTPFYESKYFNTLSVVQFILVEISCCYLLLTASGLRQGQRQWLRGLLICFYLFALVYGGLHFTEGWYEDILSRVQLPLMLTFCAIYYYNLLTGTPQSKLWRQPLFWAIGGMCLAAMVMLPFSLVQDVMAVNKQLFPLAHILPTLCYLIVFFTLFKAIQWSQKTQP